MLLMHANQLLCTSWAQTAAPHALRQAIGCEQPIVQASAALRLTFMLHRSQEPPVTLLVLRGQAGRSRSLEGGQLGPPDLLNLPTLQVLPPGFAILQVISSNPAYTAGRTA